MVDLATLRFAVDTGDLKKADKELSKLEKQGGKTEKTTKKLSSSFGSLKLAAIGAASAITAIATNAMAKYSDAYNNLQGRISLVSKSLENQASIEARVYKISQDARVGLGQTADLYFRLAKSTESLGVSQERVANVTDTISKSLAVSGASAEAANAALMQLGQGFASGALRGDELNSVLEQAPALAEAIAKGMGKTVGELRALGAEGKLTADKVFGALEKQANAINKQFEKMPATIAQSMTIVNNSILSLVGLFDDVTGASSFVASGIAKISKYIGDNRAVIVEYARDVGRVFELMGEGIILVGNTVTIAILEIEKGIANGINYIADGWDTMTVTMKNLFKGVADAVGKIFYDLVNYVLGKVSDTINSISSSMSGVFDFIGVDNPFGKINLSIGEYASGIEKATKSTKKLINLDFTNGTLTEQYGLQKDLLGAMSKTWDDIANNTTKISKSTKLNTENTKKLSTQSDKLSKNMGKANKASKSAADHTKNMKKNIKDAKDEALTLSKELSNIGNDIGLNIVESIADGLRNGGSINQSLSEMDLGLQFADNLKNSDIPILSGAGYALDFIGGLFSSYASQAEIDSATGRVEFTDTSLKDMGTMFENVMNPQLKVTNTMSKYLRDMNSNFGVVAKAIVGTIGGSNLDLTGLNYTPTAKYGFAGFSSKTSQLLGTGLDFGGTLGNFDAQGYISELIKKSSFWGLVKSSKVKIRNIDLPANVQQSLQDTLTDGMASIIAASAALGFDSDAIGKKLSQYQIDIGKINLEGLSETEIQDKLSSVFSEIFSGAIDSLDKSFFGLRVRQDGVNALIEKYGKAGEESLATLSRIAVEYEQASYAMKSIGHMWEDSVHNTLDIVKQLGGLTNFSDAYSSYISNFYSAQEQFDLQRKNMLYTFEQFGVAMPKTDKAFRALVDSANAAGNTELYANLLSVNDQFHNMTDSLSSLQDASGTAIQSIVDDWLGNLSYLNNAQKTEFSTQYYNLASQSNGTLNAVDAARAMAESALKTTATKDEYIPIFDRYIAEREKEVADATNTDLLNELAAIKEEVKVLQEATYDTIRYN